MRLLLDESLTRHLARELIGHEVRTVAHEGWAGLSNGELLKRAAEAGFEVLLTGDRSLQYQQNVPATGIGVVVVTARTNRIEDLLPLVPRVVEAVDRITPGNVIEVTNE